MAVRTPRNIVLVPEVIGDNVRASITGSTVLMDSGAAIVNNSLPRSARDNDLVTVPNFGFIGDLEDIGIPGDGVTARPLTEGDETARVRHSAKVSSYDALDDMLDGAPDPHAELTRQFEFLRSRRIERALLSAAVAAGLPAAQDLDVWNATTPVYMSYAMVVAGKVGLGDEMQNARLLVVHSKVFGDMLSAVSSTGAPIMNPTTTEVLQAVVGMKILVTDRLPVDLTDPAHPKYTSLILGEKALVAWQNPDADVKEAYDIHANKKLLGIHVYWVAHRYRNAGMTNRPGVIRIRTN